HVERPAARLLGRHAAQPGELFAVEARRRLLVLLVEPVEQQAGGRRGPRFGQRRAMGLPRAFEELEQLRHVHTARKGNKKVGQKRDSPLQACMKGAWRNVRKLCSRAPSRRSSTSKRAASSCRTI